MKKILLVDDSKFLRKVLRDTISQVIEAEFFEAGNFDDAVSMFKEKNPDISFFDIMIGEKAGDKTGLDVLKEVMKINPEAKVLMLTSIMQDKVKEDAIKEGASGFLFKPFDVNDIKKELEKYF